MPTRTTVEAFVARVISGDHVGAIRDWYHDDAWMQENQAPPVQGGREALMKRETAMLERSLSLRTELLGGPMIEGDQVAIRWRFTFAFKDGGKLQQEEVAWQTWRVRRLLPRHSSMTRRSAARARCPTYWRTGVVHEPSSSRSEKL
ncbi:MAG: nuclear transport factor 2 family protein [Xanthobacteraceae bacterium]